MQLQYTHIMYPANYEPKGTTALEINFIYKTVCNYFKVDISVKTRKRSIAYPRHLFCYICRRRTKAGLREIGELIGGRDHTTVIHSDQTLKDWYDTDELVRADVANINNILNK